MFTCNLAAAGMGPIPVCSTFHCNYCCLHACVQLKHAKLARELAASSANEKSVAERVDDLEEQLRDVSSTCRSRMRWLETAAAEAGRRTEHLFSCLQGAAPLEVSTNVPEQLTMHHTCISCCIRVSSKSDSLRH